MKICTYETLQIGKIYDTLRKRSFERHLYSERKRAKEYVCGDCFPDDIFVVLDLKEVGHLKWTKILTSKGMAGWILWIEAIDKSPSFIELP